MKLVRRLLGLALALLVALISLWLRDGESLPTIGGPGSGWTGQSDSEHGANAAIEAAIAAQRSDTWVELTGHVSRVLRDDEKGSRHQRFIVELPSGATVLIAHNIDLAPRAPVEVGTAVLIRGEFEWNDRGGVVHWTHHDPRGRRPGGWIDVAGERYR